MSSSLAPTGYIASQIINALLQLNLKVRGTVRTAKPWLNELFDKKFGPGAFESVVNPDLEDVAALDTAMDGVSGVVHTATDASFTADTGLIVSRVVKFTENMLAAAARSSTVKRFVLTTSSAAAIIPNPDESGVKIDQTSWNDRSVKAAWDPATSK